MSTIELNSGRHWNFDVLIDEFVSQDLIWGISRICRFAGQITEAVEFYSVAEHSCHIYDYMLKHNLHKGDRRVLLTALMHDAHEGLIGDVPTPLKSMMPEYRKIEDKVAVVVADRFDLIYPLPQVVKDLDRRILVDERKWLMHSNHFSFPDGNDPWKLDGVEGLGIQPIGWGPSTANREFMYRFKAISGWNQTSNGSAPDRLLSGSLSLP